MSLNICKLFDEMLEYVFFNYKTNMSMNKFITHQDQLYNELKGVIMWIIITHY